LPTKNLYRVTYHFEVNGKPVSDNFQDNVLAADQTTIKTVLSSNSKTNNGVGTLVITGVGHACGGDQGVLS
jgi:hypothetical protein